MNLINSGRPQIRIILKTHFRFIRYRSSQIDSQFSGLVHIEAINLMKVMLADNNQDVDDFFRYVGDFFNVLNRSPTS